MAGKRILTKIESRMRNSDVFDSDAYGLILRAIRTHDKDARFRAKLLKGRRLHARSQ